MTHDPYRLPDDLPRPVDDGAADHLAGAALPALALSATTGGEVDLAAATRAPTVVFCYPRSGRPGVPPPRLPDGTEWDLVPGLRGCTPQACGFRDLHAELRALGVAVLAVSTQSSAYQRELAERLHLAFPILSDERLALARALRLPTVEMPPAPGGPTTLLKRMAWYCDRGRIERVWYPVFPPNRSAATVLEWLRATRQGPAS